MNDSDSTPDWPLCDCGCGEPASRAPTNNPSRNQIKGQPMKYKIGHGPKPPTRPRLNVNGWRLCTGCGKRKRANAENFGPNPTARDGLAAMCRPCRAERDRQRRERDCEVTRAEARASYHRNKGRHPYAYRLRAAERKSAELSGVVTSNDVAEMLAEQDGRCHYCQEPLDGKFHLEHKTPLARGGRHDRDNVCLSCPTCNLRKGDRTEAEYAEWLFETRGLLIKLRSPFDS